ncbi:MAG: pitrilysin family protein [Acidobacteriota bacterium]|nr:pitrilysin family protein [Acidobacteriota bacterium]MDW3229238.1 pitrilysin family protein [Acidobacteriota bacterium]MDY0231279.1 pitrilysin family protein [Candidatus Saccharicenans sp.]
MTRNLTIISILLLILPLATMASVKLPQPEKFVLDNGLTVYFLQNSELPLVSFRVLIPGAGSAFEPQGFDGLANLTATLLLRGTKTLSAEEIAESLDFMGARFRISDAEEYSTVYGECLSEHLPKLFQIAADCLISPAFKEDEYQKELSRKIDGLKAIKDNPGRALQLYFRKAYFGEHPLGQLSTGTDSSLKKMSLREVKKFFSARYRPDTAIMAVVGDIGREKLLGLLNQSIGQWPKPSSPPLPVTIPPLPAPKGKKLILVDKPDATQSYFALGASGFAVDDKIAAKASLMNTLWGGRFTSWLNTELRIKRGLTYGASSSFQSWKAGGIFMASSYTRNDKISEMLDITFDLLQTAKEKGFSDEEVESGKNYLLGQFPRTLETNASKASAYLRIVYYGLGFDYYDKYLTEISSTRAEELKACAKLLPAKDFVLVVVGKGDDIRTLLSKYGKFQEKKITDPDFGL